MAKVLDYSFARPDPAKIKKEGFTGVVRYLSPNPGKNLQPAERDALRDAGLTIGLVWEWYANRAGEGRAAGEADARSALAQAAAVGFPAYLPIYFAVDWDASEQQQGAINDYFQGVRSIFAGRKIGAYAGYYPLKRLFDSGLINYGWQTYAWSGGKWEPRAQLRQVLNGQWGGSVDYDESTTDDWGGWNIEQRQQDIPAPAATPMPNGTYDYKIKSGDTFWALESQNNWTHGTLQNLNPSAVPTKLAVGQVIKIPGGTTATVPNPVPAGSKHTIVAGDTFWGIESANGWQHGVLQGLNPGVAANSLQIGQQINTPATEGASAAPAPAVQTQARYKIVSGDTFWGLETARGWGHGTLQSLNPDVQPRYLQIGQEINVPS